MGKHIVRLRLWWHRLWIRRNEFHRSLDFDLEAMELMDDATLARYRADILRRRMTAHTRSQAT